MKRLHAIVMQISGSIYSVGSFGSSYLKGLKCALNVLGICNDFLAAPFNKFGSEQRSKIEKALELISVK